MRVYHQTNAADAILRDGFRDARASYMLVGMELEGVWVSDQPLDANEGAIGTQLLAIDLDVLLPREFEVVEEGKPYREWCVPATFLNAGRVRRL